jgi:hypothetical protein
MAKSWKIPCRQSEAVNRKRTDNTAIVLSVLFRFTASACRHGIFQLLAIVLSVLLRFTASDYRHGIFQLLAIVLSNQYACAAEMSLYINGTFTMGKLK